MTLTLEIDAEFPEKVMPVFEPAPYKVLWGGRGKAASWTIARALLILGTKVKLFIVCGREVQKSIEDSVKKLLEDQIMRLGYHEHVDEHGRRIAAAYTVFDTEIVGTNGTRFVFVGVKNDVNKVRSMEGIDILWVAEANRIAQRIWDVLLPTVRGDPPTGPFKQGSEVWIDLNPELNSDQGYKQWVLDPPTGTVCIELNWRDNPWFPKRLREQMEDMKRRDYESYLTVFEGKTRKTLKGAVYAKEIQQAYDEGRIGPHFKVNRKRPVDLSFDLGRADMTSIWFWQQYAMEHFAVDYHEDCGHDFAHYIMYVNSLGYIVRTIYLPHDADSEVIQAKLSIRAQAKLAWPGQGRVKVVKAPRTEVLGINAVRLLFPRISINDYACADGLTAISHYKYGVKPDKDDMDREDRTSEPVHDWASHGSKALQTYALGMRSEFQRDKDEDEDEKPQVERESVWSRGQSHGWMGT